MKNTEDLNKNWRRRPETTFPVRLMNDFWNDPPEPPDVPECCDDVMTITPTGAAHCATCGRTIEPTPDIEPVFDEDFAGPPACRKCGDPNPNGCELCDRCGNEPCRHGNPPGDCGTCDHEGDLAFDAARERGRR